jgi:uncharacterized protein
VRTFVVDSLSRRAVSATSCIRRLRSGAGVLLFTGLMLLVPAVVLAAQTPLPQPVGYVNDFANVLPEQSRARIDALARRVNELTRGDMVVVTLPDLGGRPVEEVSLRLGREWKVGADAAVGDQARNAGIIILLVPKESSTDGRGHCRIETGQGAEGFITDATAGALCRAQTPLFQARDYAGALEQLSLEVADRYAEAFNVTLDGAPRAARSTRRNSQPQVPFGVIVLLVILFFVFSSMAGRRRRGCVGCIPIPMPGPHIGGGWGGGSGWSGGGFGGGGGGGFGGFGGGGGFSGGGGGSNW